MPPGLGELSGQAQSLNARLATARFHRPRSMVAGRCGTAPAAAAAHAPVGPEIAEELSLSPRTIRSQMRSIYRKLGVSSRGQAVTKSRQLGLLAG